MEPKTAKQHNAPQVGESEFKPNPQAALPKMPDVTAPNPPAKVPSPAAPANSTLNPQPSTLNQLRPWTLRDLKDTRQNVREAVEAAAFVPPGAKAMLVEIIDQTFPQARLLSLDAHLHVFPRGNKQTVDFCLTISEL